MGRSARYPVLAAAVLLTVTACGDDGPTDPGEPTVEFEIVPPRPTVLNPFDAIRRGHDMSVFGTLEAPCTPFDAVGEAWHEEEEDAIYVSLSFTEQETCEEPAETISYTARVTAAGGSSRLRVIHHWPLSGEPPDTVWRAVFPS